tara:strand:+ start:10253 stop:10819 length:567 start_codon:yes stop_codon:yes gene_type:complete
VLYLIFNLKRYEEITVSYSLEQLYYLTEASRKNLINALPKVQIERLYQLLCTMSPNEFAELSDAHKAAATQCCQIAVRETGVDFDFQSASNASCSGVSVSAAALPPECEFLDVFVHYLAILTLGESAAYLAPFAHFEELESRSGFVIDRVVCASLAYSQVVDDYKFDFWPFDERNPFKAPPLQSRGGH